MSGIIDGAYTIFTDPTTYVGAGFAKAGKVARTFNKTLEKQNAGLIDKAVRKVVQLLLQNNISIHELVTI